MPRSRHLRWAVAAFAVVAGSAAPYTVTSGGAVVRAEACADGTCCSEATSDCIINDILVENAYRKTGGGSCKTPTQPLPSP